MGVIIPQIVTSDKASGAQVIDGSVGINSIRNYHFERDPGSAGNRKTFTFSGWVKKHQDTTGEDQAIIEARTSSPSADGDIFGCRFEDDARISVYDYGNFYVRSGVGRMRDTNGWYHIFFSVDTTVASNNVKLYVNGDLVGQGTHTQNTDTRFNSTDTHRIGARDDGSENYWLNAAVTNFYVIDGQALEPTDFGFTDGLTNTWKPKKYEGDFGTNGFYLPFDGSAPIGQDQSGQGNNWTPVNFGGSVTLDKATGARPILNTTQGGTQAGVGVFGSNQNVGYAVTYYDDGGGNKYYIDGVKQATLTGLIRGATYTFDTVALGSTHPFRFSDSDGGSEYTNGVAAITGTATTITIPYNAPNELYYYCTSHSGMGSSITGITTNEKLADQYASNCVLAVTFTDGDVTDVSPSIACTSTKKTLTKQGDPTGVTSSFNFYSSSTDFDGTGDYYKSASQSEFAFGTGDFTIEYWIDSDDLAGNQYGHLQISSSSSGLQENYTAGLAIYESPTAGAIAAPGLTGISIPSTGRLIKSGIWNHIALVREGTNARIYINGFLADSSTDSKDITGTYLGIGGYYNTSYLYNGRMQDLRIYKGVAKYNGSFEVPVTSPDVLPDTPSGVSGGSKLTKITDGAVSFDGTNDYLTIADSDDFNLGSGAFTIEGFCYLRSSSAQQFLVGAWTGNQLSFAVQTSNDSNRYLRFLISSDGTSVAFDKVSTGSLRLNGWSHFAVTRSGNTFYLFVDGILVGTQSGSQTLHNSTGTLAIGARNDGTQDLNGFISNLRIVKGTALYTSRFTPPTAPLTNVTNTKLLCCQSNTSATASVVEPVSDGTGYTGNTSAITVTSASLNAGSDTNTVDGDTSTSADIRGAGSFVQLVFPQQQNGTLQVNVANGNDVNDDDIRVFIDGVEGTSFDVSSQQWYTIHTGDFTTVKLEHQGSTTGYIYGFRIGTDGDTIINASTGITANGNAAATNFNPFITDIHAVRGQESGYPTFNPLDKKSTNYLSNGNLTSTASATSAVRATKPFPKTGKWYVEYNMDAVTTGGYPVIGISTASTNLGAYSTNGVVAARPIGASRTLGWVIDGTDTPSNYHWTGFTLSAGGDTMQMAFNADEGAFYVGVNNFWWGLSGSNATRVSTADMISGTNSAKDVSNDEYFAYSMPYTNAEVTINFGQKPFKFAPPEGFQPLNTANTRPETVIARPDQYVGISTYDGNNATRDIQTGFAPDLVLFKCRNSSKDWAWYDSVRDVENRIRTPRDTEGTQATDSGGLTSFNYNGFTMGNSTFNNGDSKNYVSYSFKAGGNSGTFNIDDVGYASAAAAGLDGGTLTPSGASIGTKQGFSIIQWEGTNDNKTISHGLSQTPTFIINKNIDTNSDWYVGSPYLGTGNWLPYLVLNSTAGQANNSDVWQQGGVPNATTFGVGSVGNSTGTHIAYLWHDVPGFSKFGSFTTLNSSSEYVHLGFKPAILWIKRTGKGDTTNLATYGSWYVNNSEMSPINPASYEEILWINRAYVEGKRGNNTSASTYLNVDFLSDGFKLRGTANAEIGQPNDINIYCAWAEAPSIDLFGGGATGR